MSRTLGVDLGEKRVGIAVSDDEGILAVPVCTLEVRSVDQAVDGVRAQCEGKGAVRIVVGLPLNMNGTAGPKARETDVFCAKLRAAVRVPVEMWDERLTTAMVERTLIGADLSRAKRKGVRDRLAAQAILQSYLDARTPAADDGRDPF